MKKSIVIMCILTCSQPSLAQKKPLQKPAPIIEQKPVELAPPYEGSLLSLSETMGSLSFLSTLCEPQTDEATTGKVWRIKAQQLLEAEGVSEPRKRIFIGRFNAGYNSYAQIYRTCTDNAVLAKSRLLEQGAKLTSELTSRYGN